MVVEKYVKLLYNLYILCYISLDFFGGGSAVTALRKQFVELNWQNGNEK